MSEAFNTIPDNVLPPFFYAEINSGGTPYQNNPRLLLIGQKLAGGTATAGAVIGPIQNEREADKLFGLGSMLAQMYRMALANAPFQPIYAMPLADPAGAAAAGSLTFTAPAVTGAAILWIMGRRIVFQINAADTASQICVKARNAINAAYLPVVAAQDGTIPGKCNITARHVGALGNGQEIGFANDEPNLLTSSNVTIVAMVGGSGEPDLVVPLANLGDQEYDFLAAPYSATASLNAVRDFLDGSSGRWSPTQQLYGHYIASAYGATLSALVAIGDARNDPHVTIEGSLRAPNPEWERAAGIGAIACAHLGTAPEVSRPLQTLVVKGLLPPRDRANWWDINDRQALYADGIGACKIRADGLVAIDRLVTTYQTSAGGVPDATFRDIETMCQLVFVVRYLRVAVTNRHARQSLADENPYNVAEMATPKSVRNTLIHAYNDLVALGVCEAPEVFSQYLRVSRNLLDANRLDCYLPIDVVNQLRVVAANVTAFLQYRTPSGEVAIA